MNASSGMKFFKDRFLVEIEFYDHCASLGGISSAIKCQVYGLLIAHDRLSYYVVNWTADRQIDDNTDSHTILKSTVVRLRRLKRVA